jgi:DNA modification methylase
MIINGDCLDELKKFDDNYFDSIVTDPPYEIGFMGKGWDASGIANNPEMWAECLRVLKPGGYLLSFSATRTYHRMAVAIEDSGFEIRDMVEWVYGSGFPKSLNIGKAVDKLQGNERKSIGVVNGMGKQNPEWNGTARGRKENSFKPEYEDSKGNSEYEGWGTALKPAHEPICMARKPLAEKTVAENVLKYGTGGINIDESRVETTEELNYGTGKKSNVGFKTSPQNNDRPVYDGQGRFPANLIHDNSEEVRECFPETHAPGNKTQHKGGNQFGVGNSDKRDDGGFSGFTDSGNASRFFKSIIYQAKASKSERNKGCEGLEVVVGDNVILNGICKNCGKVWIDGKRKGDCCDNRERTTEATKRSLNHHPTVKPVALMEYLIKMVTPKGGIVLDPFMGSGSTGVACVLNDFEFVGIDLDKDYCKIARARIEGVKETQTKMF